MAEMTPERKAEFERWLTPARRKALREQSTRKPFAASFVLMLDGLEHAETETEYLRRQLECAGNNNAWLNREYVKLEKEAERLRQEIEALRAALLEAHAWMLGWGSGTPATRGAKCETAFEAHKYIAKALAAQQTKEKPWAT